MFRRFMEQYGNPQTFARRNPEIEATAPGFYLVYGSKYAGIGGKDTVLSFEAHTRLDYRLDKPRYDLGERYGREIDGYVVSYSYAAREAFDQYVNAGSEPKRIVYVNHLGKHKDISPEKLEKLATYRQSEAFVHKDAYPFPPPRGV